MPSLSISSVNKPDSSPPSPSSSLQSLHSASSSPSSSRSISPVLFNASLSFPLKTGDLNVVIIRYLDSQSIGRLSSVNTEVNALTQKQIVWIPLSIHLHFSLKTSLKVTTPPLTEKAKEYVRGFTSLFSLISFQQRQADRLERLESQQLALAGKALALREKRDLDAPEIAEVEEIENALDDFSLTKFHFLENLSATRKKMETTIKEKQSLLATYYPSQATTQAVTASASSQASKSENNKK